MKGNKMSQLPVLSKTQLPSYYTAPSDAEAAVSAAGMVGAFTSVPRISLKQGRFRLKDGSDEFMLDDAFLDVAVLGIVHGISKTYYAKAWNPGDEPTQPDCYSIDGVKPASEIAAPVSSACLTCPKNILGSKTSQQGKPAKACTDSKRIAITPAEDTSITYLLIVPYMSIRNMTKHIKELSMYGRNITEVRTRLAFDSTASYPLLTFSFASFLDEDAYRSTRAKIGSAEVNEVLGISAPVAPSPAPVPVLRQVLAQAPAPAPAPVEEPPKRSFGRPRGSKNTNTSRNQTAAAAPAVAASSEANPMAELESELDVLLGSNASI